jgi:hypothetical protein
MESLRFDLVGFGKLRTFFERNFFMINPPSPVGIPEDSDDHSWSIVDSPVVVSPKDTTVTVTTHNNKKWIDHEDYGFQSDENENIFSNPEDIENRKKAKEEWRKKRQKQHSRNSSKWQNLLKKAVDATSDSKGILRDGVPREARSQVCAIFRLVFTSFKPTFPDPNVFHSFGFSYTFD